MQTAYDYLDPLALSQLGNLELIARLVVEGFVTGLHKSPHQGFNVEFSEHRQYMPGDEIRHIDWKVFGKSDRYYIKKFEEETNLRVYLVLDASRSMAYKFDDSSVTKLRYGCCLVAALTYLMLQQRDSVGLVTFDQKIRDYIPPRSVSTHLQAIVSKLQDTVAGSETDLSQVLADLAKRIERRGLVIVISDLLDRPDEVLSALKLFRYRKHEVIVFHLLDQAEKNFPFQGSISFEDMETGDQVTTQAERLRESYLTQLRSCIQSYERGCGNNKIDYFQIETTTPFEQSLSAYLSHRWH